MTFKMWLIENWLNMHQNEAIARFSSAHRDKDVNDIPAGMWRWTHDKMQTSNWVPRIEDENGHTMSRDQVFSLVQTRMNNQRYVPSGDQPISRNTSSPAINEKKWVLAKVLQIRGLEANEHVVLTRRSDNLWDLRTVDGKTRTLPEESIKTAVESVKGDDGKPIISDNPEELFAMIQQEENQGSASSGRIESERISQYQRQIEDKFTKTNENIVVSALAGTGKTTMLKHLASFKKPQERWLYLVFGKKNQIEAVQDQKEGKFPAQGMDIYTSHSFLGKVLEANSRTRIVPKTNLWRGRGDRIRRILDNMLENDETFPNRFKYSAKSKIVKLADLGKAFVINPNNDSEARDLLHWIIDKYAVDTDLSTDRSTADRDYTEDIVDKTIDLLRQSLPGNAGDSNLNMQRDHNDTLWYACMNKDIQWPKYDVVLADEVQDFNRCQVVMLQKLKENGARIIGVGDVNQSIYMFRGADSDAFNSVQNIIGVNDVNELPVNYRSCKAIIDYVNANTHVNNLQAGLDCEGSVTDDITYEGAMNILEREWSNGNRLRKPTALIARTNAPLVKSALRFLQYGINFVFMGRDLSKELVDLIGRVVGKGKFANHVDIGSFNDQMWEWYSNLEDTWAGRISKEPELKELNDTAEAIEGVLSHLAANNYTDPQLNIQVTDTASFIQYLQARFSGVDEDSGDLKNSDPNSYVVLTTAHKSKGLEFERVIIVRNDQFPHSSAKTPEERGQEANAQYVAYTRAKEELYVCNDQEP